MECRKQELLQGEQVKFWYAADLGGVEMLHARYLKHSFGRHTHEGFAIGVIRHGVEGFFCAGSQHHAVQNQIILFNPDQAHTGEAVNEQGWEFRIFYFGAEVLTSAASLLSGRPEQVPTFRTPIIDDAALAAQLCHLHATLEVESSPLARQELFLLTFANLIQRHADARPQELRPTIERHAVRRVREYLEANLRRQITLHELATLSGLSPYHLIRVFGQQVGLSPHAYLEQARIHQARKLLKQGVPIARVALDLGFTDQSHLHRHFKRLTGVTPGAYQTAITYKTVPQACP
jgi:AraC-like DNA-binding protein